VKGTTLTITGVGTVVVKATQSGNSNYAAATSVSKTITVNKASLTVIATNASAVYNQPLPR
jgi:hypothetical protein